MKNEQPAERFAQHMRATRLLEAQAIAAQLYAANQRALTQALLDRIRADVARREETE